MSKTWVLDAETKGTGANMVPLEKVLGKRGKEPKLNLVERNRAPSVESAPEPQEPASRRFKVVDVATHATLVEDADVPATVDLLGQVRSIVDVTVYVWNPLRRSWRLLTLDEQRALWGFRATREPVSNR
jgi:hypothetical protein